MARQTQYIQVKNSTGRKISLGAVTHATEDYGIQTIKLDNLENGTYSDVITMYSGPLSKDFWWIAWSVDGLNFAALNKSSPIKGHETSETPGVVELIGHLGNPDLAVVFHTEHGKKDHVEIKNPWA